jgi:ComF family protein
VDYAYPWDRLIARFKFQGEPGWAPLLSQAMLASAQAESLIAPGVVLVPVPVTRRRLAERGYNQSWELARALAKATRLAAWPEALVRVLDTTDQHCLPHAQRLNNLRGAFAADPSFVPRLVGARVLLIDDVQTTGATLHHAARALVQAGVAQVNALVLARTPAD